MSILGSYRDLVTVINSFIYISTVLAALRLGAVIAVSVLRFWRSELSDLFRIFKL